VADARLVIGVDGGGSRCTAVLARRSAERGLDLLGRGHGGPANPRTAGHDAARLAIAAAVEGAFADAGIAPEPAEAICLGLAGVGRVEDRDAVVAWATQAALGGRVIVVPDGLLPFADGHAEPWGIVLISGTGSLALARPRGLPLAEESPCERCGGWGPLLGDEGSGYAIGLAALRAVMRSSDGRGPATILHEAMRRRFTVATAADLVARLHAPGVGRREVADVAREVVAAADVEDAVATAILGGAAADLAAHVITLARRLDLAAGVYPLRLAGGLLTGSVTLRRMVLAAIVEAGHEPGMVIVVADPAASAAQFAALATV